MADTSIPDWAVEDPANDVPEWAWPSPRDFIKPDANLVSANFGGTSTKIEPDTALGEDFGHDLMATLTRPAIALPKFTVNPDDSKIMAVAKSAANLGISLPEFVESPLGIATMGAGSVIPKIVAGLFAADTAKSVGQQATQMGSQWDTMTPAEKAASLTDISGTTLLATTLGHHAAGKFADVIDTRVNPAGMLAREIGRTPLNAPTAAEVPSWALEQGALPPDAQPDSQRFPLGKDFQAPGGEPAFRTSQGVRVEPPPVSAPEPTSIPTPEPVKVAPAGSQSAEKPTPTTPAQVVATPVGPPEPLGLNRPSIQNPELRQMTDAEFDAEFRAAKKNVNSAEKMMDDVGDIDALKPEQRQNIGKAQDRWTAADLERFRRNTRDTVPEDLFLKLKDLAPKAVEFGLESDAHQKAQIIMDELQRQGATTDQMLREINLTSPDAAEVFKADLEDIKKLSSTRPPSPPISQPEVEAPPEKAPPAVSPAPAVQSGVPVEPVPSSETKGIDSWTEQPAQQAGGKTHFTAETQGQGTYKVVFNSVKKKWITTDGMNNVLAESDYPQGAMEAADKHAAQPVKPPTVETDPARVQEIRNSIVEGEGILKSGHSIAGQKLNPAQLDSVKRSVESSRAKIGEPPVSKPATTETVNPTTVVAGTETVHIPLKNISLSADVPQFKANADEKGIVKPIGGKFDRRGLAPIQVWRRMDGRLEIISGRHRFDLAQRTGEKTIPAQIHNEADGFDARAASRLDAELNIRDEQGEVTDYANYFKDSGITEADAKERGLLARTKGKAGFAIARDAGEDLFALHQSGKITDAQADAIARSAPGEPGLQAVGIRAALDGRPAESAADLVTLAKQRVDKRKAEGNQTDLFGFDDSAIQEMEAQSKLAASERKTLREQIQTIKGAAKKPAIAKQFNIDVKDPEGITKKVVELEARLATLKDHPELAGKIDAEPAKPDLKLEVESDAQRAAREAQAAADAKTKGDKEKLAAAQAKPLVGSVGDMGQGVMPGVVPGDGDMFSGGNLGAGEKPGSAAQSMGGLAPGDPSEPVGKGVMPNREVTGLADRVRKQREAADMTDPTVPGQGIAPEASVDRGRQLLKAGVDPEKAMQNFEATKRASSDDFALARAQQEALAKVTNAVEEKFGTDSPGFRSAYKTESDWAARTKAMQTEWAKSGQAQQGGVDIDTGTFAGIARAVREVTGKDLAPSEAVEAKKIAKNTKAANDATEKAKVKLDDAIENLDERGLPRYSDYILKIAEGIVKKLDARAAASRKALAAMSMRFNTGIDPTLFGHLANIGASHIAHWGLDFAKWSDAMIRDTGPKIVPDLPDIFEASKKLIDAEGDTHGKNSESVKSVVKKERKQAAKPTLDTQRKAFQNFESGKPMSPDQVKTLWQRAKGYIDEGSANQMEAVGKLSTDLGIPVKDVVKGLAQNRTVRRVADNVWQKQRQARILKQAAKRWIENTQESWFTKSIPMAARVMFKMKTGLHGTVALGTHAAPVLATNPIIFKNNFGKMYKLVASPDYYLAQQVEITRRPNYNVAQRAGLVNDMAKMEDFNDPKLTQSLAPKVADYIQNKLKKVKLGWTQDMGTRGYAVLKILRQDLFDNHWNKLAESEKTPEMAKAIADSVNHITGVVKAGEKVLKVSLGGDGASLALFAPKLLLSRIAVMAGDPVRAVSSAMRLSEMTPEQKWFATNQIREKAKIFGVATGLLLANQQLNNLFGDKTKINGIPEFLGGGGWNPMESDFMKFKGGGMTLAWGSPFFTMARLPMRMIQIGMGDGGKSKFLIYPDESMSYEAFKYARTQTSPFLAPVITLLTKADYEGRPLPQIPGYGTPPPIKKRLAEKGVKPYTWGEFAAQTALPIPFQEAAKEIFHYGFGGSEKQKEAYLKAFTTIVLMSGTGGRIADDWEKGGGQPFLSRPGWKPK